MKSIICFLIGSFCSLWVYAQDWPAPGAVWYFDQEYGLCFGREYSKWQYVGDSLKPEGRRLNFIRHVARLDYPAPGAVNKTYLEQHRFFMERNDSLFYENSSLIADFNRITGDSTFSPFHDFPLEFACNGADSLMITQKASVIAHGQETVGNQIFKWYKIEYVYFPSAEEAPVYLEKTYHQRYFTPQRWFLPQIQLTCTVMEYCFEVFQCYRDEFMSTSACSAAEYTWEHLNMKEPVAADPVSVFPNPVSDVLNLEIIGSTLPVRIEISNMQGIRCKEVMPLGLGWVSFDVSQLSAGIYLIRLFYADGSQVTQKFIKH